MDRVEQDIRVMQADILRRDGQLGGDCGETPMDVDQEALADNDEAEFNLSEAQGRRT